jgi:sugar phosphate isomerase/epimerase
MSTKTLNRRSFLAAAGAAPLAKAMAQGKQIPVGLELYSVRDELKQDLMGTVRAVAAMGYQDVEFYSPYYEWTADYAKQVRKLLDDLGIRCHSTHNSSRSFEPAGLPHAIEINRIIGSKIVVMASAGRSVENADDWKRVAATLSSAAEKLRAEGMRAGFHNHDVEWKPVNGQRPMDVLAANTPKDFVLQLDVGTCLEMKQDPVAFIKANPGRVNSYHLKEWSDKPDVGYKALLGEGVGRWSEIFAAAESVGGAEHYLIEQEGSRFPPLETAKRCLEIYRKMRAA